MITYIQALAQSVSARSWGGFAAAIAVILALSVSLQLVYRVRRQPKPSWLRLSMALLISYGCFILWITVVSRVPSPHRRYELIPLWSWYEVLVLGNTKLGYQILLNIILFMPLGVLLTRISSLSLWGIWGIGLGISVCVELCQLIFCLGLYEWDDMLHNSMGCLLGSFIAKGLQPK